MVCHSLTPTTPAATTTTTSRLRTNLRVKRRRRRPRSAWIRSRRLIADLGGPTASGSARLPRTPSAIGDVRCHRTRYTALIEPGLQNRHRGGLVDHRALVLGRDAGRTQ